MQTPPGGGWSFLALQPMAASLCLSLQTRGPGRLCGTFTLASRPCLSWAGLPLPSWAPRSPLCPLVTDSSCPPPF